jgi:hypothetical protein
MPDHIDDIPINELEIFDGDELLSDGSDSSTYILIEPGASAAQIIAALGCDDPLDGASGDTAAGQ